MTLHEMIVEILAIQLYQHDNDLSWLEPKRPWLNLKDEYRQTYRNMVLQAETPTDLYGNETPLERPTSPSEGNEPQG